MKKEKKSPLINTEFQQATTDHKISQKNKMKQKQNKSANDKCKIPVIKLQERKVFIAKLFRH